MSRPLSEPSPAGGKPTPLDPPPRAVRRVRCENGDWEGFVFDLGEHCPLDGGALAEL